MSCLENKLQEDRYEFTQPFKVLGFEQGHREDQFPTCFDN